MTRGAAAIDAELAELTWPLDRLGEALQAVAAVLRAGDGSVVEAPPPEPARLGRWLDAAGSQLGLEVEAVEVPFEEFDDWIASSGPALLQLPDGRLLVALGRRFGRPRALDPRHRVRPLPRSETVAAYGEPLVARHGPAIDALLDEAGIAARRRPAARREILRHQLAGQPVNGGWLLRLPPGSSFGGQLRQARQPRWWAALIGGHTLHHLLWIVSWWLIGRAALSGRFDLGWLVAWALLLLTLVPLRLLVTVAQGRLAIGTGALLKRRLLQGILRLDPDALRLEGIGKTIGRVIESDAIETLALSTAFNTLVAAIEIVLAAVVLGLGAARAWHLGLLAVTVAVVVVLTWWVYRLRSSWTAARLDMTHALVEGLVGHRTRLAQEPRESWHRSEDADLGRYLGRSRAMDDTAAWLDVLPRAWMVAGLAALAPAVAGGASPAGLAVSLGGVLLVYRALSGFAPGLLQLASAGISWRQVAPVFRAAAGEDDRADPAAWLAVAEPRPRRERGGPETDSAGATAEPAAVLVEARELTFRYPTRPEPVLRGSDLRIGTGDRLLLEGPSGSGKSSLASLLVGLRQPTSGLLLLRGLDRSVLGYDGWRRLVVAAPQFHENHVFTETFAFNLLMGRRWPSTHGDLEEAVAVCRELGLGELLERMPAGLLQMVGESGWQLSHGERSRLFLARALLQGGDLLVFDESFAALDPENLGRALSCVLQRAPTLLVIAHP